jgi:hypothetical protein
LDFLILFGVAFLIGFRELAFEVKDDLGGRFRADAREDVFR